jgi:Domain of unknown function (DUF1906)
MARVVDYAWARPSIATIRAQGSVGDPVVGVIRYLSLEPAKNLNAAEYAALRAAGFAVGLVWETAADIALGGRDQGVRDARRANAQADALGYPGAIYYAVDFDVPTSALPVILTYLQGVQDVGVRRCGVYGSYAVVEACSRYVDYFWQTSAWSQGKVSGHANLYQHIYSSDLDVSAVRSADWGQDTGKKEDDLPITDDDAAKIARAVHNQPLFNDKQPDGKAATIGYALHVLYRAIGNADELSPAAIAAVTAALAPVVAAQAAPIAQAVVALQGAGPGGSLSVPDVEAAVKRVLEGSRIVGAGSTA